MGSHRTGAVKKFALDSRAHVVGLIALVTGALIAVMLPAIASAAEGADSELVVVAASAAGDAWDSPDGDQGASVLTHGHIGCLSVDAVGQCADGLWGLVPGASWIWRSQMTVGDGLSCDEYPFFTSAEGGPGASLQLVPDLEQNIQGGYLRAFYSACLPVGRQFRVEPRPSNPTTTYRC